MATNSVPSSSLHNSVGIPDDVRQAITVFLQQAQDKDGTESIVDRELPGDIVQAWLGDSSPLKLVEAVKFLGPDLTSEDESERLRAVVFLSLLVTTLAKEEEKRGEHGSKLFDKQSINTFATFFAQKIEDGNAVAASIAQSLNGSTPLVPESAPEFRRRKFPIGSEMLVAALRALSVLSVMDTFSSDSAKTTTEMLLQHSSPRVHPQAIRFLIFTLMDSLLSRHRQTLKRMGQDFVNGYIELIEGEKDPRNLVYIFAMDRVILIEWDTMDADSIESFFDCTYCYFPITFRPPPDDPYGITTNSLRIALRRVLCASPLLAPHALPLLIEKMQASGGNAKRDTLDTLADALPVFGRSAALAHARELWQGFRIEIVHATDEATSICAQRALEALLFVLFVGEEELPEDNLAVEIIADMLDELEEPSKQQAKPACTILAVLIRATSGTCRLATKASLVQLLAMYKQTDDISIRPAILQHLTTLVNAMRENYEMDTEIERNSNGDSALQERQRQEEGKFTFAKPSTSDEAIEGGQRRLNVVQQQPRDYEGDGRPMDGERELLITTVAHGLETTTTRAAGVDLFVGLSHVDIFSPLELRHLCASVNALLVDASAESVRVQALDGLRDLGNQRIVEETTLPLLFNALPDRIDSDDEKVKGSIRRALGALARLCDRPEFFEVLVVRLSTKLDLLCASAASASSGKQSESEGIYEANVGLARGLLGTLTYVLQRKIRQKHRDTAKYGIQMVPRLLGLVIYATLSRQRSVARDRRVIRDAAKAVMLFAQTLDKTKQQQLADMIFPALYRGDIQPLASGATSSVLSRLSSSSSTQHAALDIFAKDAPNAQRDLLYVFTFAIVALDRQVIWDGQADAAERIVNLLQWTTVAQSSLQEEAGSFLLANWVNKDVGEPVSEELQRHLETYWANEIESSPAPGQASDNAMDLDVNTRKVEQRRQRAIRIWLALTRGFLVKNSKHAERMVARILTLFEQKGGDKGSSSVMHEAARGMGILLRDDEILCKENGTVIRLLYRQRFVTFVLPKLLDGHKQRMARRQAGQDDQNSQTDNIHLVAICSLLPNLPRAMLLEKLQDLFPLLILALDFQREGQDDATTGDDGVVQSSAAHVITLAAAVGKRQRDEAIMDGRAATALGRAPSEAVQNAATQSNSLDLVKDQLNAIVRRLIHIVESQSKSGASSSSDDAKVAALRCLKVIAQTVDYTSLHIYKIDVLRALGAHRERGIDDAKRVVRLEAVDCRDAWFRLKDEDEEEEK